MNLVFLEVVYTFKVVACVTPLSLCKWESNTVNNLHNVGVEMALRTKSGVILAILVKV